MQVSLPCVLILLKVTKVLLPASLPYVSPPLTMPTTPAHTYQAAIMQTVMAGVLPCRSILQVIKPVVLLVSVLVINLLNTAANKG